MRLFNSIWVLIFLFMVGCVNQWRRPSSVALKCPELIIQIFKNKIFGSEISHPDFYLWDNWAIDDGRVRHLYSLAADRNLPSEQRHFHAHWHHFTSTDQGKTWIDEGAVLKAREADFFDNQAIWSGSVTRLKDGKVIAAYTGLSSQNTYLQSISLAVSDDFHHFDRIEKGRPLLSHLRDRKAFIDMGYYVDTPGHLGSKTGEVNGSIQSLRDPFLYQAEDGRLHLFWSAKAIGEDQQVVSAIGHAEIKDLYDFDSLQIRKPIIPPDGDKFTQLELPNITKLPDGRFAWIVSTTNRVSETQALAQTDPQVRLYFSNGLQETLNPFRHSNSTLFKSTVSGTYGANLVQNHPNILLRVFRIDDSGGEMAFSLPQSIPLSDLY